MTRTTCSAASVVVALLVALPVRSQEPAARPFADGVISTPQSACITFAPGGEIAYFMRSDPAAKKSSILVSRRVAERWSEPDVASFSGTYNEGDPAMSPDGSRLVFWSWRSAGSAPAAASSLWYVERQGEKWGSPRPVEAGDRYPVGPVYGWGPSIASNGTLYFFRAGPKPGGPPWLSRALLAGGRYAAAEHLDESVNGAFGGGDTGIAPDERFLVFSSSRPDSLGAGDLYVSYRRGDRWTEPRHLGPLANSRENEICPAVVGQELFFSRSGRGIFSIPLAALGIDPRP
jgi:hypothetical protein